MTPNKPTDVYIYVIVYQKRRLGTTAETFTKGQLNKTSLIFITCLVKTEQCWNISSQYWAVQWSWFAWVNALCNLSHKKSQEVAASLLGWFLSRRCFTLCITTEAEPRIAKQDKCHHCCSCKSYQGKGMEGGKKVSWHRFSADQKIASSWKKCVLGHPIARATSYCLLPDTFWLWASKNVFKVGSVKFANSLSLPSIVKKSTHRK